jgi:hypothetical protein
MMAVGGRVILIAATSTALLVGAIGAGSASGQAATHCVKATRVKPPKPAPAHYTGAYNDKSCTEPSATNEGRYELLGNLTPAEEIALLQKKQELEQEKTTFQGLASLHMHRGHELCAIAESIVVETNGDADTGAHHAFEEGNTALTTWCFPFPYGYPSEPFS